MTTIRLEAGERVEVARAVGRVLRVEHQLVSGTARTVGAVLECDRSDAWERARWRERKRVVREWLVTRITAAFEAGDITRDEALDYRDAARDGRLDAFPVQIQDRIRAYLGREPVEVQVDSNANRTIVRALAGRHSRRESTVLTVEVVAGAGGAVVEIGAVESRL